MRTNKDKFGIATFIIMLLASLVCLGSEIAFIPLNMIKMSADVVGFEVPMFIFETLGIVVSIYLCFLAFRTLFRQNDHKEATSLLIYTFVAVGVTCLISSIIEVAGIASLKPPVKALDVMPLVFYAIGSIVCISAIFIKKDKHPRAKYIATIIGLVGVIIGEIIDLVGHFTINIAVSIGLCLIIVGALFAIIYCILHLKDIKVSHKEEKHG